MRAGDRFASSRYARSTPNRSSPKSKDCPLREKDCYTRSIRIRFFKAIRFNVLALASLSSFSSVLRKGISAQR